MNEWIKIFLQKFIELAGDEIAIRYECLAKQVLEIWGIDSDPQAAAIDEASYYV